MNDLRVAIVHDWLLGMRGGERCLEVLCGMFPEADLFTAFYRRQNISAAITRHQVTASSFNRLPFSRFYYRHLLPLYPLVARSLTRSLARRSKVNSYDLVISVSHCLAKNVERPQGAFHLSYCLTPMRYIWDQYASYFAEHPFEPLIGRVAERLRRWDRDCAAKVDHFAAISEFVAARILTVYQREAEVIYPPVRTDWITPRAADQQGEGFLCVSALVPYKNVELIVRAFNSLPYKLTVIGTGPLEKRLRDLAGPNIFFRSRVSDEELAAHYRAAQALVFGAEEDFGMVPVECQAAGRPVICYGRGGARETVLTAAHGATGLYFEQLTVEAVQEAVIDFARRQQEFTVDNSLEQAKKFSLQRFESDFCSMLCRLGFGAAATQRQRLVKYA